MAVWCVLYAIKPGCMLNLDNVIAHKAALIDRESELMAPESAFAAHEAAPVGSLGAHADIPTYIDQCHPS